MPGQSRLTGKLPQRRQFLVMTKPHVQTGYAPSAQSTRTVQKRVWSKAATCACDGARVRRAWGSSPSSSACCVTLGKPPNLPELVFAPLMWS